MLRRDGNYLRAYEGVASALLRKGEYRESMKYAKLADAGDIYNKAFEGWRREFLGRHFSSIAAAVAAAAAALIIAGRYRKKKAAAKAEGKEEKQQ